MAKSAVAEAVRAAGFNWSGVALGQLLSLCSTAGYAAHQVHSRRGVDLSATLMVAVYGLLAAAFWGYRVARRFVWRSETSVSSDARMIPSYALVQCCVAISLLDVAGSVLTLHAVQFISVPRVTLISTFSTPTAMALSYAASRARYRPRHVVGASLAVLGAIGMCVLQMLAPEQPARPAEYGPAALPQGSPIYGYIMSFTSAVCYGTSNVLMEALLKGALAEDAGVVGVLATNSTFATLWTLMYFVGFRRDAEVKDYAQADPLLVAGFILPTFAFYVLMPVFLSHYSAALLALSLLTINFMSLPVGAYVCNETMLSFTFIVPFIAVVAGIAVYNAPPFWRRAPPKQVSSPL
jgi:drug/metabolite transporter (DMT)-like permease